MLLQRATTLATNIHPQQFAGEAMEARLINDHVELVQSARGFDAARGDPLDGRFAQIDQLDVIEVEGLVVIFFAGTPLRAERMFRDQFLGYRGIRHALANLLREELGNFIGTLLGHEGVTVIAEPQREAATIIQHLITGEALRFRHAHRVARIRIVDKAGPGAFAQREDLVRLGFELLLLLSGNRTVAQWRAPIGSALKNGQLLTIGRDRLDDLDASRAGADDPDALARKIDRLLRPSRTMQ